MTIDLDDRLRTACHAVIPHLLDEPPSSGARVVAASLVAIDAVVVPLRAERRRARLVSIAATLLVVAGAAAVWSTRATDREQPAAGEPTVAAVTTVPATQVPATQVIVAPASSGCLEAACGAVLDRLPVVAGATDFYAGPDDLGTPQVELDFFDSLTRCAELTADFSACQRVEGIAGVSLVSYATDVTIDTTVRSQDSFGIEIGTTFTTIAPIDYARRWFDSKTGSSFDDVTVRGHDAVRYRYLDSPVVVWQERPGVLVSVSVPPEQSDRLLEIAEGVRRLDGPTTIPDRVMVVPVATQWDAWDNDGDGVIAATTNGTECVGLDYIDTCGEDIVSRTIVRGSLTTGDPSTRAAGSAPASVTQVRLDIAGAEPVVVPTVAFADHLSRYWSTVVAGFSIERVTWLDAQGTEVDTTPVSVVPPDSCCVVDQVVATNATDVEVPSP